MSIYEIQRRHLIGLFDEIEDSSGAPTADQVRSNLLCAFRWWSERDESFVVPVVKRRTKPSDRERTRVLDDDEIRILWRALDEMSGEVNRFVRVLLLTGQRRIEVAGMHPSEIKNDVWTIPVARFKGKRNHVVPLSPKVQELIAGQTGFVFSRDGGQSPISSFGRLKAELDAKITEIRGGPLPKWTLHDLRRTARSLMSDLTTPDIAERVIGHKLDGIRAVYDQNAYLKQKTEALQALADRIERILKPDATVVPFVGRSRAGGG
jgi:integrase